MKLTKTLCASLGAVAVMAAISGWALTRLPNAPIPAHWGLDGRPDRFADPAPVLFMLPATGLLLSLLLGGLPALMPPRGDLARSRRPYIVTWLGAIGLLLVVHLAIVASAMGVAIDMTRVCAVAVGVLLLVIGNYLPKVRFNYVMGVRTPWTLADERVWDQTHRFAGACMLAAGALVVVGGLSLADPVWLAAVILVPTLTAALAAVVYSAVISPRVGAGCDSDSGEAG